MTRVLKNVLKILEIEVYTWKLNVLVDWVRSKTEWETQQRRSRHANKLAKIIPAGSTPDPNTMEDKWVLNLSNRILSETEKSSLSLGLNYAITPKKLQVADLISLIEQGIGHLPGAEKDIISASVTVIANGWRPPKRCNITTAQEKALKSLAKDPSITILPADKGRCVVVMNTSDYSAGSEIALSWSPMRLNILHWRPEFHNWSPAGD